MKNKIPKKDWQCPHGGKHKWVTIYRSPYSEAMWKPEEQKCLKCGKVERVNK